MTTEITTSFTYPFYGGVGSSKEVPNVWDVAFNGVGYLLDTNHPAFTAGHRSIPLIRQQADNSVEPSEASLNPEDLWPRSQVSWHMGAGQRYLDIADSDRRRFWKSLGLNPWERGQLALLRDVDEIRDSSNTNLKVIRVGSYLYIADGTSVVFALTPYSSWTSSTIQAGESAQTVNSITSDGYTVYAALGSNGIHKTTRAATSSTHYSDLQATLVGYVKGRLMAALGNSIYNVIASGVAPTPRLTQPNTDFTWVGFAEGRGEIYAAGYSGDKSLIYRVAVEPDGTELGVPVVAGELPDGEIVRSIQGYLGFVVIGTDIGFRLAVESDGGDLTIGALVRTDSPVQAFEPQSRFVWFGWKNYDATHTGLGRMDLSLQTESGAPPYATDLMASGQGEITGIATDSADKRVFCVSGDGVYVEAGDYVTSGTFDSGLIGYGVPDPKIALRLALKHKPLPSGGSVAVYVSADEGTFDLADISNAESSIAPAEPIKVPEVAARLFEVRMVLAGAGTILERYDLRAYPSANRGMTLMVPLRFYEELVTGADNAEFLDVRAAYDLFTSYVGGEQLVGYQELGKLYSVFVEEIEFQRHHPTADRQWWNGTMVCRLKVLGGT